MTTGAVLRFMMKLLFLIHPGGIKQTGTSPEPELEPEHPLKLSDQQLLWQKDLSNLFCNLLSAVFSASLTMMI